MCCGAVYKSESDDLILIDVAKFKPCQRRHYGSLSHLTAVAQDAEIPDNDNLVLASSSCNSTDSLSTQDSDIISFCDDRACHTMAEQYTSRSTVFSSSVPADGVCNDDGYNEDDDSCSVLQTDESMEAASPSRDTDEDDDALPASSMAATGRSILCNLLWSNRPFSKSDHPEGQSDFVWSEMQPQSVNIWPSKPSTVKVYP